MTEEGHEPHDGPLGRMALDGGGVRVNGRAVDMKSCSGSSQESVQSRPTLAGGVGFEVCYTHSN